MAAGRPREPDDIAGMVALATTRVRRAGRSDIAPDGRCHADSPPDRSRRRTEGGHDTQQRGQRRERQQRRHARPGRHGIRQDGDHQHQEQGDDRRAGEPVGSRRSIALHTVEAGVGTRPSHRTAE